MDYPRLFQHAHKYTFISHFVSFIYLSSYTAWLPRWHFRQVCAVEQDKVEN